MLSQFRKAESRRPFRGCLRKSSPFMSFSLTFGKLSTKFEMLCKKPKSAVSESLRGDERVRARRACGRGGNGGRGRDGRQAWHRGGCGADGSRRAKSKAAVRQPCSLSTFDSLKPMQSGFFGSRGLFPKKVLESGCGVKPRIYTFPHVGVRGAQPRYTVSLAGRPAPRSPYPLRAHSAFTASASGVGADA